MDTVPNVDVSDLFNWILSQLRNPNPSIVDIAVQYLQSLLGKTEYRWKFWEMNGSVGAYVYSFSFSYPKYQKLTCSPWKQINGNLEETNSIGPNAISTYFLFVESHISKRNCRRDPQKMRHFIAVDWHCQKRHQRKSCSNYFLNVQGKSYILNWIMLSLRWCNRKYNLR